MGAVHWQICPLVANPHNFQTAKISMRSIGSTIATAILTAGISTWAAPDESWCAWIASELPSECHLRSDCMGLDCSVDLFYIDTIGFGAQLNLCNDPIGACAHVNESDLGINYGCSLTGQDQFPIPGFSIDVPIIGEVGVELTSDIAGTSSGIDLKLGLIGCAGSARSQGQPASYGNNGLRGATPPLRACGEGQCEGLTENAWAGKGWPQAGNGRGLPVNGSLIPDGPNECTDPWWVLDWTIPDSVLPCGGGGSNDDNSGGSNDDNTSSTDDNNTWQPKA